MRGEMPYTKRIVCLANSYKIGGTCIAGKEVRGNGYGPWIRPVSARETREVLPVEARYSNHADPKILDIIDLPLLEHVPQHHQAENHVIDTTRKWEKVGEFPLDALERLRDDHETLWINSDHTVSGSFDCMSPAEAATQQDSLKLIKPDDFRVEVGSTPWKPRIYRGNFKYKGSHYNLGITDPVARAAFAAKAHGRYPIVGAYICVSLTEPAPQDGRCHKLVATIIGKLPD